MRLPPGAKDFSKVVVDMIFDGFMFKIICCMGKVRAILLPYLAAYLAGRRIWDEVGGIYPSELLSLLFEHYENRRCSFLLVQAEADHGELSVDFT
jgi:hypothetical protein